MCQGCFASQISPSWWWWRLWWKSHHSLVALTWKISLQPYHSYLQISLLKLLSQWSIGKAPFGFKQNILKVWLISQIVSCSYQDITLSSVVGHSQETRGRAKRSKPLGPFPSVFTQTDWEESVYVCIPHLIRFLSVGGHSLERSLNNNTMQT